MSGGATALGAVCVTAGSLLMAGGLLEHALTDTPSAESQAADALAEAHANLYPPSTASYDINGHNVVLDIPGNADWDSAVADIKTADDKLEGSSTRKECLGEIVRQEIIAREAASRCILATLRTLDQQPNQTQPPPLVFKIGLGLAGFGALAMAFEKDSTY